MLPRKNNYRFLCFPGKHNKLICSLGGIYDEQKNLPHLITVVSFVVFIVLGLACASSSNVKEAASVDELTSLQDKFEWLSINAASDGTFLMNGGIITNNHCFQIQNQALVRATDGKANAFSETPRRGGGIFTKTGGTITGFASDSRNGNATRTFNNLDVSQNNGHAVFAALGSPGKGIFGSTVTGSKRKETTAGPNANLHIGSDGTFNGNWDF